MAEGGNVGGYYTGMFIIGFVLLFIAIANLAVGIANAVICGMLGSVGYGIWGSVLCFIAAISGIIASQSRSRSSIVTHMVFAILAAVSATVQLGMGAGSAVADFYLVRGYFYSKANYESSGSYLFFQNFGCSETQRDSYYTGANGPTVTDSLLASFAIIQGILAVVTAAFSCRATVCPPGVDHMPWESQHLVKA
jgi:hypothetical protein